jgi:two-component system, NarL family, response regulator DevR
MRQVLHDVHLDGSPDSCRHALLESPVRWLPAAEAVADGRYRARVHFGDGVRVRKVVALTVSQATSRQIASGTSPAPSRRGLRSWPRVTERATNRMRDVTMVIAMHDTRHEDRPVGPLRLMLVDDHEVVRSGLKAMLEADGDVRVVAEAGSVRDAIVQAGRTMPDVIVMDVQLADGSGIEATREIRARRPETRVLMLTSFADDEALFASIMAGASGYVLKQIHGTDLARAIRQVGQGQSLLDPAVTATVLDRLRRGKHLLRDERLARLSAQEERILSMVAEGLTNREIGVRLKLAEKTVKNYVSTILSKLEVSRRAEAAAYLARHSGTPGSRP